MFDRLFPNRYASSMNETITPTLLITASMMIGIGLYFIQRGRFLIPALMYRIPYLRTRPKVARFLFLLLLTLGVVSAGMGCRILLSAYR